MFYTIAADGSKTSTQLHMNELLFRWRGKTWIKYLWSRIISVSWGFVLSKSFISQDDSSCMAHVHRAQLWDCQKCLDMGFCTANLRAKAERFTKCKPLEPWKNSTFLILCWAKMKQPGCFPTLLHKGHMDEVATQNQDRQCCVRLSGWPEVFRKKTAEFEKTILPLRYQGSLKRDPVGGGIKQY